MILRSIILLGKPGSGKGTLAKDLLKHDTELVHMSTGDIFRANMEKRTPLGQEIIDVMNSGELVNDELTIAIVEDFILQNKHKLICYDGFPRNRVQLDWLLTFMLDLDLNFPALVELQADNETVIQRILNRGKDSNRHEDQSVELIQKRLSIYDQLVADIKEVYTEFAPELHYIIDGNQTPHKVLVETIKSLSNK